MYVAMEVRLFGVPEGESVSDLVEKVREALDGLDLRDYDGDVEIDVLEHAGLECAECGTRSGRHREI